MTPRAFRTMIWGSIIILVSGITGVVTIPAWHHQASADGVPVVSVLEPTVDLGLIRETRPDKIQFVMSNSGTRDLHIRKITVGCPCLHPRTDRDIVPPGEQCVLTINGVIPERPGQWTDNIMVFTNDPLHPTTRLTVTAFVELGCQVMPSQINIANLTADETREVNLCVIGPSDHPEFQVRGVTGCGDSVSVTNISKGKPLETMGRQQWNVRLQVRPRGEPAWKQELVIATSYDPSKPLKVPLEVRERPGVLVEPSIVTLRYGPGQTPSCLVHIRSADKKDLRVTSIEAPDWMSVEKVEVEDGAFPMIQMRLGIRDPVASDMHSGTIKIGFENGLGSAIIPFVLSR